MGDLTVQHSRMGPWFLRGCIFVCCFLISAVSYAALSVLPHNDELIVLYNPLELQSADNTTKIVRIHKTGSTELASLQGSFITAAITGDTLTIYRTKNYSTFTLRPRFSFIATSSYTLPLTPLFVDNLTFWGLAQHSFGWVRQDGDCWKGTFFNTPEIATLTHLQVIQGETGIIVSGVDKEGFVVYKLENNTLVRSISIKNITASYLIDEHTLLYTGKEGRLRLSRFDAEGVLLDPRPVSTTSLGIGDMFAAARIDRQMYFIFPNYLGSLDVLRGTDTPDNLTLNPVSSPSTIMDVLHRFTSMIGGLGVLLLISMCISPFLLRRRLLRSPDPVAQAVAVAIPRRVVALCIDVFLSQVLPMMYLFSQGKGGFGDQLDLIALQNSLAMVTLISYGYFYILERRSGQTIGKRLVGIRVISLKGSMPTTSAILFRNILRYIDSVPSPLYFLAGFFMSLSKRGQRLGDMVSRTVVVKADFTYAPEYVDVDGEVVDAQA